MRKLVSRAMGIVLVSLLFVAGTTTKATAQDETVSYQQFYDDLSPYGQWVNDAQYGNVWVPNESGDFRPYGNNGHWVMTDYGNTWVSDDPWGWACYHYGRWTYDSYYGWLWVPGYEWAPAWVSWRYGGGYSGWAPLGPGIGVGVSYNCPESWWVFVQPQYMYERDCYSHWRGPSYNGGYIRQTSFVNNAYVDNGTHVRYNYGPRADMIQRDTHTPVQVYHVSRSSRPGAPGISGNSVSMYRPSINRGTASTARPANVVQAPRRIGGPQAATASGNHQPAFRQQVQQGHVPQNTGVVGPNNQRGGNANQPAGRPQQQPQPQQRSQPQQQNRPQPQAQPQQRQQPQPQQRQQPQPQQRPQPQQQQRPQPQPQQRPQPQPQPQQRPQPQMQQPQSRPQPMPQQQRQAPPQHQEEHEGGRR